MFVLSFYRKNYCVKASAFLLFIFSIATSQLCLSQPDNELIRSFTWNGISLSKSSEELDVQLKADGYEIQRERELC